MSDINKLLQQYNENPEQFHGLSVHTLDKKGHARMAVICTSLESARDMLATSIAASEHLDMRVVRKGGISRYHWLGWGLLLGVILAKILSRYTKLFS